MATIEWAQERGRELIKSEVVELDESSAAELFALGIVGTSIGAFVGLIVGIERHGSPVIASVVIDDFAVEIALELAAQMLRSSAPFSNREIARVKWGSVLTGTETKEEESDSKAASVEGEAPGPAPPAKRAVARARPTIPSPERIMSKSGTESLAVSLGESAKAFAQARAPSIELVEALQKVGLESHIVFLGKANVTTLRTLQMHTLDELEDSLRRPQAHGAKFTFSPFERRMLDFLGVQGGAVATAAVAPSGETLDFGGLILDRRGDSSGPTLPLPEPVSGVLSGAPYAAALLGTVGTELDEELVAEVLLGFAEAAQSASSAAGAHSGASLAQLVDKLDLLLESLCDKGTLTVESLTPSMAGRRAAAKLAAKLTMRVEEGVRERQPSSGGGEHGSLASLSRVLTAAHSPRLSATEEKVAEEIAASQARLETVSKDPKAMAALSNLASLFETKESETVKLASYAKVATNVASIAALLKASHVKDPKGELVLLCPEAELCVKLLRVVKNGVKTALKAINRRFLPGVDTSSLVEATLAGQLIGDGACTVADLALSTKAKVWLGVAAAAASNTAAASKANQLAVMLKALPLISFSLMQMQPEDETVAITMMDVMANVARGVAVRSVGDTVAGLLVPLMRAYGEAFDSFQKSATVAVPILGEVWAKERLESTVTAFMASVAAAEASAGATASVSSSAAQPEALAALEKKLTAANKRLDSLAKTQKGFSKALSDVSDDEEDAPSEKTLANRAKRKAKAAAKARKGQPAAGAPVASE